MFLGYFEKYPDYMTQGSSIKELKENLLDIYHADKSQFLAPVIPSHKTRKKGAHIVI